VPVTNAACLDVRQRRCNSGWQHIGLIGVYFQDQIKLERIMRT